MENKYKNRDLSWCDFNERILQEVICDIPIMEKVKMLSISDSNLNEFIMVRLSKAYKRAEVNPFGSDFDGVDYKDLLKELKNRISTFKSLQDSAYLKLRTDLVSHDILLPEYRDLNDEQKKEAKKIFTKKIRPLLLVNYLDKSFKDKIVSKRTYIIVRSKKKDEINDNLYYIEIPTFCNDFYRMKNENIILRIEDIIINNLKLLLNDEKIISACTVRFLRSAHYEFPECSDEHMYEEVEEMLAVREKSFILSYDMSDVINKNEIDIIETFLNSLLVTDKFVYKKEGPINLSAFINLEIHDDSLYYSKRRPIKYGELSSENMLDILDRMEHMLLQHPYESYDPVIKLLEDAAKDERVIVICQTLYRVSDIDSPIINALCKASAVYRKQVNVIVELKARFDEGRNLAIRNKLKEAGCNVMYSRSSLKIHAKCMLIIKNDEDEIKYYSHIGTGNYNEKTARLYTDISYLTTSKRIGKDIYAMFTNMATKITRKTKMKKLVLSPFCIRDYILNNIEKEIKHVVMGDKGKIIIKVNSLSDERIINALYEAADNGVDVTVITRGICSIDRSYPNIKVKSVIGRYLEHHRIYYFYNGGKEKIAISSADCLRRNLDRRIEILLPIEDKHSKAKLKNILMTYVNDTDNSFILGKDGIWRKMEQIEYNINAHEEFYN